MHLSFIESGPALLVKDKEETLVIADLHFGIESNLARHGYHLQSRSEERAERVLALVRDLEPDRLLLLGDVKQSIPLTTRQEYRELPTVLAAFRDAAFLQVIPGNHDAGLERFLEEGELLPATGVVIDGVGYLHGHTIPDPALAGHLIIIGHHHPVVSLIDEVGCAARMPAYLRAPLDERALWGAGRSDEPDSAGANQTRALLMPAFNELSGFDITKIVGDPSSPVSRAIIRDEAEVFLADGTFIGPYCSLEEDARH
jgi:metallophosphoesterase superfamily enzyme